MKSVTSLSILLLLAVSFSACTEKLLLDQPEEATSISAGSSEQQVPAMRTGKLRNPQMLHRSLSPSKVAGKFGENDAYFFVAYSTYEADGVTRRLMDSYHVTRRVLEEYGVTRRVLDSYGVTRRILDEYGVTRRVLDSYAVTRRVLDSYGVTRRVLDEYTSEFITYDWLESLGVTEALLDAQGVTRRVLDEYEITRRVLSDYNVTEEQYGADLEAHEPDLRLRIRFAEPSGISMRVPEDLVDVILEEVADDEEIEFIEPDPQVGISMLGREGSASESQIVPWNIDRIGTPLTDYSYGAVDIFMLDSGVMDHDLSIAEKKDFTMLFENRNEETWDDDAFVAIEHFDPGSAGDPLDHSGHGTHVAGIIGAENNSVGVLGAAPHAKIHSLKVLTDDGRTDVTTVVAALNYVIDFKTKYPSKPVVVNMSFGTDIETTANSVLDDVVESAIDMGIVVVVSAGNDGSNASTYSPAHVEGAITVGSFGLGDVFSSFSNTGSVVDILAPGEAIVSLSNHPDDFASGMLVIQNGTSMATPHVTGAAAHYLSMNPAASPADVANALLDNAQPGVTGVPGGTTDKAVYVGEFARDTDEDNYLYISRAKWQAETATLELAGKSHQWVEVTLRTAGSGTELGKATTNDLGEWVLNLQNPSINPCVVIAERGSEVYAKGVESKPVDCEKVFNLDSAKWTNSTHELRLMGQGPVGAGVKFSSGNTGVEFAEMEIGADGMFTLYVPYETGNEHLVPCNVAAEYRGMSASDDVTEDPSVCDYGFEVADNALYISSAKYLSATNELVLTGKGAKEAPVLVASTGSGTHLGSSTVYYDAEWTVTISDPTVVPCTAIVSSDGSELTKDVSYAPDDCEKSVSMTEARWYADPGHILLEGTGVAGTAITFSGTALGNEVATHTVDQSGLFSFTVDWTETHTIPCDLTASSNGTSIQHEMRYAPFECDFGANVADQAFYLASAKYFEDSNELVLTGEGAKEAQVVIASMGSGSQIGSGTVYYNAEWSITIPDPLVVPCTAIASSDGAELAKDVYHAPDDCEKSLTLTEARWYADPGHMLLEGTGVAGSTITFSGTALGNEVSSMVVDPSGLFSYTVDWAETHTVPCNLTAASMGVSAQHEMRYAPFECDFGMNNAEFPFEITDHKWVKGDKHLLVAGRGARSAEVVVRNPASGIDYPAATVYYDGTWEVIMDDASLVPCAIEARSEGQVLSEDVSEKPSDCDFNTYIEEATWNPSYQRLTVKGHATKYTMVVFRNASTGDELGSDEANGERKAELEMMFEAGAAEPCTVEIESVNGQIKTMAVAGATATCQ